ncbi:MAG: RidA family protein [Halieaceae bacterium]|nr:RidA family protein [Halieaceae bacterium]
MPTSDQIYHKRPDLEKGIYFAQTCKVGDILHISGCVSWDAEGKIIGVGDMRTQVTQVYTDIRETLEAHDLTFKNIIKETVFTIDIDALVANNDVRIQFYKEAESAPPAATWIGCSRLVDPDLLLEIECIAQLR